MEKIFNFIKLNKKLVIILSIVIVIIIGLAIFLIVKNDNKSVTNISTNMEGYASDNEKDQEVLYQPFEESDIKFKVYGEISRGLNLIGYDGKLRIKTKCNNATYDEAGKQIEEETTTYALSSKPIEVGNHCIVSINTDVLNGYDYSSPYDYENHKFLQRLYLTAYIELPDGTLISLNSYGNPIIQVNFYEKETRIVLENGSAYFRIAKQDKNKIFTIQVGNKIFSTTGGTEIFVNSNSIYTASNQTDEDLKNLTNDFVTAAKGDKSWKEDISSYSLMKNGSFTLIKGTGNISDRGSTKTEKMKNIKYEFLYRYTEIFNEGEVIKKGNVINVIEPSLKKLYVSIGYYEATKGMWGTKEEVYDNLDYQLSLNELDLNMDKIITKKGNVGEIVTNYLKYHSEQVAKRLTEKEEARTAYIKKRQEELKEELKTCKNDNYYYVPEAEACCPNGYVYDSKTDKCVKYGCKDGYYDVGGLCCPIGTVLKENKCVSSSNKTSAPTYYPKGSSGNEATCVNFGTATAQLFCPAGNPRSNAYISNGKCCIKYDNIPEPQLEPVN